MVEVAFRLKVWSCFSHHCFKLRWAAAFSYCSNASTFMLYLFWHCNSANFSLMFETFPFETHLYVVMEKKKSNLPTTIFVFCCPFVLILLPVWQCSSTLQRLKYCSLTLASRAPSLTIHVAQYRMLAVNASSALPSPTPFPTYTTLATVTSWLCLWCLS